MIGQQEKDAPQVRGRGTTLGGTAWLSLGELGAYLE